MIPCLFEVRQSVEPLQYQPQMATVPVKASTPTAQDPLITPKLITNTAESLAPWDGTSRRGLMMVVYVSGHHPRPTGTPPVVQDGRQVHTGAKVSESVHTTVVVSLYETIKTFFLIEKVVSYMLSPDMTLAHTRAAWPGRGTTIGSKGLNPRRQVRPPLQSAVYFGDDIMWPG